MEFTIKIKGQKPKLERKIKVKKIVYPKKPTFGKSVTRKVSQFWLKRIAA